MKEYQPDLTDERVDEGDEATYSIFGYEATANEIHAAQLGMVGIFGGLAYTSGLQTEALGASALLIGLAFGVRKLPDEAGEDDIPIAIETKRHEPWWFTTPYIITFIGGIVVGGMV